MFEHDTEVALAGAAALVNDPLPDVAALGTFLEQWRWTSVPRLDDGVLRDVQTLRPRLHRLWIACLQEQVYGINALLAEHRALPRLVRHGEYGWHVHATDDGAPLHARMAVEAAMAMVDLVRAGETERLRSCADQTCGRVLVDLSKNRSKAYCDPGCANRAHAAAYRLRRSRSTPPTQS